MAEPVLGRTIAGKADRDAVHIAVYPAVAGKSLWPGTEVAVVCGIAIEAKRGCGIGIVDPFLASHAESGERFWVLMHPKTTAPVRHDWSHAGLDHGDDPACAIAALAESIGETKDRLMAYAERWVKNEDYWIDGGRFEGLAIPLSFWTWYEAVTGDTVPEDRKCNFLSCSC